MLHRCTLKKLKGSEADNRLGIDIPLIVAKKTPLKVRPNVSHCSQKHIKGRVAAPFEVVLVCLYQPHEALRVPRTQAFDTCRCPGPKPAASCLHLRSGQLRRHSAPHVGHIHAKDPEQPVALRSGEFGKGIHKSSNIRVASLEDARCEGYLIADRTESEES